jgi:hypothetical protein
LVGSAWYYNDVLVVFLLVHRGEEFVSERRVRQPGPERITGDLEFNAKRLGFPILGDDVVLEEDGYRIGVQKELADGDVCQLRGELSYWQAIAVADHQHNRLDVAAAPDLQPVVILVAADSDELVVHESKAVCHEPLLCSGRRDGP